MAGSQKSTNEVRPGGSSGLVARLWAGIKGWIPLGYEDETGFQYGIEAASSFLERPPENGTGRVTDSSADAGLLE